MTHQTILKYVNEGSNAAKQSKREKSRQNITKLQTIEYNVHDT